MVTVEQLEAAIWKVYGALICNGGRESEAIAEGFKLLAEEVAKLVGDDG